MPESIANNASGRMGQQTRAAISVRCCACVVVIVWCVSVAQAQDVPEPIVLPETKPLGPFKVEGFRRQVFYMGQHAQHGVIDLVPNTAFFGAYHFEERDVTAATPTFRFLVKGTLGEEASGEREELNRQEIEAVKKVFARRGATQAELDALDEVSDGNVPVARWHLFCEKKGDIAMTFYMKVSAEQAAAPWIVEMAQGDQIETKSIDRQEKEAQELRLVESGGAKAQPHELTFAVKQPGRVTFYFDQRKMPKASGAIALIRLHGSAVDSASLLRSRYRPSAFYSGFRAPENCLNAQMWVIETKLLAGGNAFAPIKTPFGYFGMNFNGSYVRPLAAFHWSMWGSAENKDGINMALAPRIVASANPQAVSGVNAHEGITVRGAWGFYSEPASSVIQAMRATRESDGSVTYYGYVYDETAHRWKLYDAAQEGGRRGRLFEPVSGKQEIVSIAQTNSFLEVPGAFGKQMSGDARRTFARRAWFMGGDHLFYAAQMGSAEDESQADAGQAAPNDNEAGHEISAKGLRNMFLSAAEDCETRGWILAATGGMAYFKRGGFLAAGDTSRRVLPEYLQPEKAKGLLELPVTFAGNKATNVTAQAAGIEYTIESTGPHSKAIVYYGTEDCNAHIADEKAAEEFAKQERFKKENPEAAAAKAREDAQKGTRFHNARTEKAKLDMLSHGWKLHTDMQDVKVGGNLFTLKKLAPNTRYFYRIHVVHDEGMSWDYTSGTFTTRTGDE